MSKPEEGNEVNEVTLKELTDQMSVAKDALRMALAGINELAYKIRGYARQEKARKKQNTVALRALKNIKRLTA